MGTNGQITDHEKEKEMMSNMNRYDHNNNNGYFQQLTSEETKTLRKSTED